MPSWLKIINVFVIFLFAGWLGSEAAGASPPKRLRVLILSGQNNHDWKSTTPLLKEILEASGRFACDVTENPAVCTTDSLAGYDVLVSNWTNFPSKERAWGPPAEKAILDFVRAGKGFVVFHAGSSQFYDWPDFFALTGSRWGTSTGHGPIHTFKVSMADPRHPITRGLKDFWITDELWHRAEKYPAIHVLCKAFSAVDKGGSGEDETVALWTQFGKGRGFNLVLGHYTVAMRNAGWRTLMLRGTEWAATGRVTIAPTEDWPASQAEAEVASIDQDALFKAVGAFKDGQSRQSLQQAEKLAYLASQTPARRRAMAARLVAVLDPKSGATFEGRQFCCRQLGLIGSSNEVSLLASLLGDKELNAEARYALERIPGPESLAAMRKSLRQTSGLALVGLVNTLGERRDEKSVKSIAACLGDQDARVAGAALDALGKIGTRPAALALRGSGKGLTAELQARRAHALVACADRLAASGDRKSAAELYRELTAKGNPSMVRMAATSGLIACAAEGKGRLIMEALANPDGSIQRAGVDAARKYQDAPATREIVDVLPGLDPVLQACVIGALMDRGDKSAAPALLELATKSRNEPVRTGALAALGKMGDPDCVAPLAQLAGGRTGVEQEAVRKALVELRGAEVDGAMLKALKTAPPAVQRELVLALIGRDAKSSVPAMLELAGSADHSVRLEAVKAVGTLGSLSDCPALLKLIGAKDAAGEMEPQEAALLAIARRNPPAEAVRQLSKPLEGASGPVQGSLMRVLGRLGGPEALALIKVRAGSSDPETHAMAIRVLADWPDAAPIGDLIEIAAGEKDPSLKVIALRGFARLVAQAENLPNDRKFKLIAKGLKLSERAEEKKALVGQLGKILTPESLPEITACLDQTEVKDEATLAAVELSETIWMADRTAARAALQKVLAASKDPAMQERANGVLKKIQSNPRPNLALMAKASSPDDLVKDGQAGEDQAAIDGDPNTYWDEQDGEKLYRLILTFPFPIDIATLRITGYTHHSYAPKDFAILCDGKAVKAVKDAVYTNNVLTVELPRTRCGALELKISGYYGLSPAIRELEVFGPEEKVPGGQAKVLTKPLAAKYEWRKGETSLALLNGGQVVWQFNCDRKEGKPYFHPLALGDGTPLTWLRPPDHPWHRAMWFSWKFIDGVNYWEENPQTGRSDGMTEVVSAAFKPNADFSAHIALELSYHTPGNPPVLTEHRAITVERPDHEGAYGMNWQSTFTAAGKDVELGGHGGGYEGLACRVAEKTRQWEVVDSEGRKDTACYGQKARWMAFQFTDMVSGRDAGIAIFDHPANPRHPTPWYVLMQPNFGYFCPAFLLNEPYKIQGGKSLHLRYRIQVHPGRTEPARLERMWSEYAGEQD